MVLSTRLHKLLSRRAYQIQPLPSNTISLCKVQTSWEQTLFFFNSPLSLSLNSSIRQNLTHTIFAQSRLCL
jgi:hypothetical protein